MSSQPEHRQQIDQIALDFETRWSLQNSNAILLECYLQLPCDELLMHLIAADHELARNHGQERNAQYYLAMFPANRDAVEEALSEESPKSRISKWLPARDDSLLEIADHFFPELPCRFGKYNIIRCIAGGGMAAVFEAKIDNQVVALKLPYQRIVGAHTFSRRFEKEVMLLSKLSHPNIIPVLDWGVFEGRSYYAMPLIEGEGLNEKCTLERLASLSPVQSVRYLLQATDAMAYAHSQRILHRDIKPSNILVDKSEHAWVVDFGLGTFSDSDHSITCDGKLLGTPTWMPPEQASGTYTQVDQRSDVYSLGATLYSLLTGRVPYSGATTGQLLLNIQRSELIPPKHLVPAIPWTLNSIVMKCMEKEPWQRYQSAHELAEDLRAFLNGKRIQARPRSVPIRVVRWCRLYPRRLVALAAVLTVMLILAITTYTFQHVARLKQQIAEKAETMRDEAVSSEAQKLVLLTQAERERRRAEDAADFAEAQNLRMAFQQAERDVRDGRQLNEDVFNYAHRFSLDSLWYLKYEKRRPKLIRDFCTGDWGHYDVALDANGKRLATVSRNGNVDIWNVDTGSIDRHLRRAEIDPDKGFAWNRWRHHAGRMDGFVPTSPPQFFSSVTWTARGSLLVAGLDGSVIEFLPNGDESLLCRTGRKLYFIRAHTQLDRYLVVDQAGVCSLIDASGNVDKECRLDFDPSWAGYAESIDKWIIGSVTGELVLLDQDLKSVDRLLLAGRVHDVSIDAIEDDVVALVTCDGGRLNHIKILNQGQTLQIVGGNENVNLETLTQTVLQARLDRKGQRLITLDHDGDIRVKNLSDGTINTFNYLMANKDVRHPYPEEIEQFDSLEGRSRYFLLPGVVGTMTVDCSGTVREFDFDQLNGIPRWSSLSCRVGPDARIAIDPMHGDQVWALDRAGTLRVLSLTRDKVLAEHAHAHAGGFADLQIDSHSQAYTAGKDAAVHVWRYQDGVIQRVASLKHDHKLLSVALHEGRGAVGSVDVNGSIVLFDLATGTRRTKSTEAKPSDRDFPVLTGRLAFSRSGQYVTAFTRSQGCVTLDVDTLRVTPMTDFKVADQGGLDVCFSPKHEHRLLLSSNGIHGNELEIDTVEASSMVSRGYSQSPAVDFCIPEDQQRVVALLRDGQIAYFSPEHFVFLSMVKTPLARTSSMAIAPGNQAIVVCGADGELVWQAMGTHDLLTQNTTSLASATTNLIPANNRLAINLSSYSGLEVVRDRSGHLTTVLRSGGLSEKSGQGKLLRLSKANDTWLLDDLRFEGDDYGPCEQASLFKSPTGELVAVVRQRKDLDQDYNARVLCLRESIGRWQAETIQPQGNAGFCPTVIFADDGTIRSVWHLDFEYQRLFRHQRDAKGETWYRHTTMGNIGFRTRSARDTEGTCHLITAHLRGFDSSPPHVYMTIDSNDRIHQSPAKGSMPLWNKMNEQIYSYELETGVLYRKRAENQWSQVTRVPFPAYEYTTPIVTEQGDFWCATCMGDYLLAAKWTDSSSSPSHDSPWTVYRVALDGHYSTVANCVCNINAEGGLEILLFHAGEKPQLLVMDIAKAVLHQASHR